MFECEVEGEIPPELEGAYYRTGGDRQYPSLEEDIILNGDGMASMFRFENGHVSFRSRYVQTERLKREREARRRLYGHYRNKLHRRRGGLQPPRARQHRQYLRLQPPRRALHAARGFAALPARSGDARDRRGRAVREPRQHRADRASQDRSEDRRMVELRRVRARRADHRRLAARVRQGRPADPRGVVPHPLPRPQPRLGRDPRAPGVPDHAADRRRPAAARGRAVLPVRPRLALGLGDHAARRLGRADALVLRFPAWSWAT